MLRAWNLQKILGVGCIQYVALRPVSVKRPQNWSQNPNVMTMSKLQHINFVYETRHRHREMARDNSSSSSNNNNNNSGAGGSSNLVSASETAHNIENAGSVGNATEIPTRKDFWSTYDFSLLREDEYSALNEAAISIQCIVWIHIAKQKLQDRKEEHCLKNAASTKITSLVCMFLGKRRALKLHRPIYEFKVISRQELVGVLASGKAIRIKVQPYFPAAGEVVTAAEGSETYILRTAHGTRAAAKRKAAKKRKIGNVSGSVPQMKDSKVRGKAASAVKQVKQLQAMTTYSSADLEKACPSSDAIMVIRDEIAVRPDTKQQGLQKRKEAHFAVLVPEKFQASTEKRKELGKYFCELGKCLQNNTSASKRKFTCTSNESRFLECVYGEPRKKPREEDSKKESP